MCGRQTNHLDLHRGIGIDDLAMICVTLFAYGGKTIWLKGGVILFFVQSDTKSVKIQVSIS